MLTQSLILWYHSNKRELPWRNTKDPYTIWLSEVILQQTRVEQGLPYFNKILQTCPNIDALASIPKDKFFKLWQGLGYYRRAENILATASEIVVKNNGIFPNNYHDLIQLKGIGPYTAAAVASIAFGEPCAVLDGNVYRVLSRLFAVETPTDGAEGKKLFNQLAAEMLDHTDPSSSNQAIMELGALICTPKNPLCNQCPLQSHCSACANGSPENYPVRKSKIKASVIYQHYIIPIYQGKIPLRQRVDDDIWRNLFEPPCIQLSRKTTDKTLIPMILHDWITGSTPEINKVWETTHILTHRKIHATFWVVKNGRIKSNKKEFTQVPIKLLPNYPVHRLFDKFLRKEYLA